MSVVEADGADKDKAYFQSYFLKEQERMRALASGLSDQPCRSFGGPDDNHYAKLGAIQPIEVIECWSKTWPQDVVYQLSEAINMISRVGTKGQPVRDLKKAIWLLQRALTAESMKGEV